MVIAKKIICIAARIAFYTKFSYQTRKPLKLKMKSEKLSAATGLI